MRYYDYYNHSNSYLDTIAWGIVMIVSIVLIVWAIFSLGSYILRGIGMYTIAKRIGIDYAWLAFVPFARTYLHGELSGTILLKKKRIQNPGVWLLALPFLYGAVYSILYTISWFVGFGNLMKMDLYSYMPYNVNITTGDIMGMLIILLILMVISVVYTAFYKAFEVLVNHQILERFTSKNMSIAHAILCTIIPMYESICFFVMRNRPFNPGMEPPTPTPFMQSPPPGSYYDNPVQTGYSGSSTQGGYGSPGGTPSPSDTNRYSNFYEQSVQTGTNYNNYWNTPVQSQNMDDNYSSSVNSGMGSYPESSGILQKEDAITGGNTIADPTGSTKTTENSQEGFAENSQGGTTENNLAESSGLDPSKEKPQI